MHRELPSKERIAEAFGEVTKEQGSLEEQGSNDAAITFRNPANGHTVQVSAFAWLWCLLFGVFYLIYKGIWNHVLVFAALAALSIFIPATYGIALMSVTTLAYAIGISNILIDQYSKRGWLQIQGDVACDAKFSPSSKHVPTLPIVPDLSVLAVTEELEKLARLKGDNIITDSEFLVLKGRLLAPSKQ